MKNCKDCQIEIPVELIRCSDCKKIKDKENRERNKDYAAKYSKYYYLKNILKDPDYNKKFWEKQKQKNPNLNKERWEREKELKKLKELEQ